jgi:hypothetical protein
VLLQSQGCYWCFYVCAVRHLYHFCSGEQPDNPAYLGTDFSDRHTYKRTYGLTNHAGTDGSDRHTYNVSYVGANECDSNTNECDPNSWAHSVANLEPNE